MFKIPSFMFDLFRELVKLKREECDVIIKEIRKDSSITLRNISKSISSELDLSEGMIQKLLILFSEFKVLLNRTENDIIDFIEDIKNGLISENKPFLRPENDDWSNFDYLLQSILTGDNIISYDSKARELMFEHKKIFQKCRIIQDFRPVFREKVKEGLLGGILTHTLKIDYLQDYKSKSMYFVLDSDDVSKIKETIDREYEKLEVIQNYFNEKNIKIIELFEGESDESE